MKRVSVLVLFSALLVGVAFTAPAASPAEEPEYFITIEDGEFMNGCKKFYPAGWNQWEVVEAAGGAPSLTGASLPNGTTGPALVRSLLDSAVENGLNVMRTWAYTVDAQYALQPSPGVYSEAVFAGLDSLLDEARARGVKLILAFTSNWTPVGGAPQYVEWAGAKGADAFYTNPTARSMFKDFVSTVLRRVNTINGRRYSEDPTIFAWNLINEPRCTGCAAGTIASWVSDMAAFVKGLDANHLLTVGEDGFFGLGADNAYNPGTEWSNWAAEEGQDFIADHSSPDIDFATFHAWVDNWQEPTLEFQRAWISSHADAAARLKKPVLLEEFGKWFNVSAPNGTLADRNTFMDDAYSQVSAAQRGDSPLKGALFWQYYAKGQIAPESEGGGRGLYGIYATDDVFDAIRANAAVAAQLGAQPLAGCAPRAAPDATAPPSCASTRVDGEPGTGMTGPDCDVPINECVAGTATCAADAACIDTERGYDCVCHWGFSGDGKTCTANAAALKSLADAYWGQPRGSACDAGKDVDWPTDAPGFVYEPISNFTGTPGDGAWGSRTNVTLQGCEIACQMAPTCESFVYNDVLQSCFLKRTQCPIYNACFDPQQVMCNSTENRAGQIINYSFPCGYWRTYYRLDMDVAEACDTFKYNGTAPGDPDVVDQFEEFAQSPDAAELARGRTPSRPAAAAQVATAGRR